LDRVNGARAHMAQPVADAERIAVRRRTRGAADPDAAARAGDVSITTGWPSVTAR
jgi:hypothetical protein